MNCKCGRPADFEVYRMRDPHCMEHMMDAISGKDPVYVRKIQPHERYVWGRLLGGDMK